MTYFPDPPFVAQQTLRTWQRKNHPWLELSDVHKETTENVRVTVIPFYMGCRDSPTSSVYWVRIGQMVITFVSFHGIVVIAFSLHVGDQDLIPSGVENFPTFCDGLSQVSLILMA